MANAPRRRGGARDWAKAPARATPPLTVLPGGAVNAHAAEPVGFRHRAHHHALGCDPRRGDLLLRGRRDADDEGQPCAGVDPVGQAHVEAAGAQVVKNCVSFELGALLVHATDLHRELLADARMSSTFQHVSPHKC